MIQVQKKSEKYNSDKVRQLLRDFGDKLVEHLHDEVCDLLKSSIISDQVSVV